ncbi:MAG: zinc metalloprotease HtpX [Candidatus Omnitrophica bacterium]|nr:zinc metalloprotease HtpX [Candidatus Omnitrophota bacterium]
MIGLQLRLFVLLGALFAIIYAAVVMVGAYLGVGNFYFYLLISAGMMAVQYMIGPKIVEWTMQVRYLTKQESPELFRIVEDLARKAKIQTPKIGVSPSDLPNAFAFGRGIKDGRICVTKGILRLLDEKELGAVIGHEMSHLKNRDVLTITILSVIPMIMYRLAFQFLFYGNRRDRGSNTMLLGIAAFLFYFITNLLVLYASRIREYFADRGSVSLGNSPSSLASALYKLVYGAARMDKEELREIEGIKAFFASDPSRAWEEIRELKQLDRDASGTIDAAELDLVRRKTVRLRTADKFMELLSTHPNMLKRIKQLSSYKDDMKYASAKTL